VLPFFRSYRYHPPKLKETESLAELSTLKLRYSVSGINFVESTVSRLCRYVRDWPVTSRAEAFDEIKRKANKP
jgi:hypothetical protein